MTVRKSAAAVGWVESSRPTVRGWVATSSGGPRRLDPPYSRIPHADLDVKGGDIARSGRRRTSHVGFLFLLWRFFEADKPCSHFSNSSHITISPFSRPR